MRATTHNAAVIYIRRQAIWHLCWTAADAMIMLALALIYCYQQPQGVWRVCNLIMFGFMLYRAFYHGRKAWQFGYYLIKKAPKVF